MLHIARQANGSFHLRMPTPVLSTLRGLPAYVAALLQDPLKNQRLVDRLFPRTYDDEEQETEYRELIGQDLFAQKREALESFEGVLEESEVGDPEAMVEIAACEFDGFLAVINDVRVLLGADLGIESDQWDAAVSSDQADKQKLFVLQLLTYLEQELLVATGLVDADPDIEDSLGE